MHADHRAPHSASQPPDATPVVLVVDDDSVGRTLTRRVLEADGHTVLEAESGRQALELLRDGAGVAAIVTDLKMSDGSGGWLLAHVAYEFPRLLHRVLVLTGDPQGASAAHVAVRWRCPVLPKPIDPAHLLGTLGQLGIPSADVA